MIPHMSDSESLVMDIVWKSQVPVSPGLVMDNLESCRWKYKTVATFLTRLTDKGLLECKKQGKQNLYTPKYSKQEYIALETRRFLEQYHQGSVRHLVAALYESDVDQQKLSELLDLIDREG